MLHLEDKGKQKWVKWQNWALCVQAYFSILLSLIKDVKTHHLHHQKNTDQACKVGECLKQLYDMPSDHTGGQKGLCLFQIATLKACREMWDAAIIQMGTVFPQRHSWCCTWLCTQKVSKVVSRRPWERSSNPGQLLCEVGVILGLSVLDSYKNVILMQPPQFWHQEGVGGGGLRYRLMIQKTLL